MGWDELMETLKKRFEEQKDRHEGGSKMIGTGGTSPFGAYGFNPQGIRIGQDKGRNKSAVKVWDQRAYKDYDDSQELGTRNIKIALRRLRKFAREGAEEELDLDDTIKSTAANAGYLDIKMVPERHNNVKVLLLMDVGGTMDEHIRPRRGDVLGRQVGVQAPGVLLLPQLRLRLHVEEQPAPLQREVRHLGHHPQVQQGLQAGVRRRRDHEPLRDPAAGRQRRIQQRGSRRRMDPAPDQRLPQVRLDQPRTARRLAVPPEHQRHAAADEPAHVPADDQGPRRGDAAAVEIAGGSFAVHRDFDRHPKTGLKNEMVFITYLNHGWQPEWGSALELWDAKDGQCVTTVQPEFGRTLLMPHGPKSFHGHPTPLQAPDDRPRRSVATYFYTGTPMPEQDLDRSISIFIQPRRIDAAKAMLRQWVPPILWRLAKKVTGR
jgi:hypothetical protein